MFNYDNQGGFILKESETGYNDLDTFRFNKSCVPRNCSALSAPENGTIISSLNSDGRFAFPQIVQFACNFGHQVIYFFYKYFLIKIYVIFFTFKVLI